MELHHAEDAAGWRRWLDENGESKSEIWLLFYKKGSGLSGVPYEDAVDEALCFGWIDSMMRRVDEKRYARRFTPRRAGSVWSESNVERVRVLKRQGRMTDRGLELFEGKAKPSLAEA